MESRRLPAWLQGGQALRPASGSYPPRGALGRYGLGYKLLMQDQLGMGKTVEAGLIAAEMALRDAVPFGLWTIDGQHQLSGLHRWEGTVGPGTAVVLAEAPPRPEPFAPRKFRVRLVPQPESYQELRWRAEKREAEGRDQDRVVTAGERRVRDTFARKAVLLRSEGRCENPWCLLPVLPYRTRAGEPLLEIDHIDDHAQGGRDHPSAMIALCPNCHVHKTRGADGASLREHLRAVARELDAAQDRNTAPDESAPRPRGEADVLAQCAALFASLDDVGRERALAFLTARFTPGT
ncbi:HNH endonuclease [Streptomyces sp. NBC_01238]|uniref:HNH endonuclease n=1 Tax=Streptomyces sp. NBC_01238 TaxID=2903791 RepID=UPI00386C318C